RRAAVQYLLRQRRPDRRGHRRRDQQGVRKPHRTPAVAGRRRDAGRQCPYRAQQGVLRGAPRGARRDGRPGTPRRLLADHRGERQMTTTRSTAADSTSPQPRTVPPFAVVSGAQVRQTLHGREKRLTELVTATYRLHSAGGSVNPPSYFLRFPDRPSA